MNQAPNPSSPNQRPALAIARMASPVAAKLGRLSRLSDGDKLAISRLTSKQRAVEARSDIARPAGIGFLLQGYAHQYVTLPDGRRQIMAILLPGDQLPASGPDAPDAGHSICAITNATVSEAAPAVAEPLLLGHPAIAGALRSAALVNRATLYERIVSLGRRSARERVAHLLCETFVRSQGVGLDNGMQCIMPVCQADIADLLGLSLVHTNRSLQGLRADRLVRLDSRLLTILDFPRLQAAASFNPSYLRPQTQEGVVPPPSQSPAAAGARAAARQLAHDDWDALAQAA